MGTSWKNKLVGAVAAGAIVAGLFPVAALGAPGDSDLTLDSSITVSGLENGDTADYYQILELDVDTYKKADAYSASETYYTKSGETYTVAAIADAEAYAAAGDLYVVDKVGTNNWKLTANVDSNNNKIIDGTDDVPYTYRYWDATANEFKTKTVTGLKAEDLVIASNSSDNRRVTFEMANAISKAIADNTSATTAGGTLTAADNKVSVSNVKPGLYMFVAAPGSGNGNTVYKPVFVSADYNNTTSTPDDMTDSLALVSGNEVDTGTDYDNGKAKDASDAEVNVGNQGVFKRSLLDIDKKSGKYDKDGKPVDTQNDVAVGDVVEFTINVPLPTYTKNFEGPVFDITDVLTDGLELVADSIKVEVKSEDGKTTYSDMSMKDKDFTITEGENHAGESINGFVVKFLNDNPEVDGTKDGILYKANGTPVVTITYKAKVTSEAAEQVNQMDNTATLNFSNKPSDTTGVGELKDKTRHYTFDLDANVFGSSTVTTTDGKKVRTNEIRKVAVDADGNVIQEETYTESQATISEGTVTEKTTHSWLEGAEFKLTQTHEYINTGLDNENKPKGEHKKLDSDKVISFNSDGLHVATGGGNAKSDANGYIPMKGLDAGTYELVEVKAPLGYTFNPNIKYIITITPEYDLEPAETPIVTSTDGKGSNDDLILKSYKVSIKTQELDDNLNPKTPANDIITETTYTAGTDAKGQPISFLNDGGTTNEDAGITVTETTTDGGNGKGTALITNKKLGLLPATGGSGIYFYLAVGGAIAGVSLYLMKKDERAEAAE